MKIFALVLIIFVSLITNQVNASDQPLENTPQKIIAHWNFDEIKDKEIVDISGNQHNGIINNKASITTGKVGQGIQFFGDNGYIRVFPFPEPTGDFSVSYWFSPNYEIKNGWRKVNDHAVLVGFGDNPGASGMDPMGDIGPDGRLRAYLYGLNGFPDVYSHKSIWAAQSWNFITITYKSGPPHTLKLYLDGKLEDSMTTNINPAYDRYITPNNFYIGGNAPYTGEKGFLGIIDEVKIYNYSLTEPEIQNFYSQDLNSKNDSSTYVVQRGDSIWKIACQVYGDCKSWLQLIYINNLTNPSIIHRGNILKLPVKNNPNSKL